MEVPCPDRMNAEPSCIQHSSELPVIIIQPQLKIRCVKNMTLNYVYLSCNIYTIRYLNVILRGYIYNKVKCDFRLQSKTVLIVS